MTTLRARLSSVASKLPDERTLVACTAVVVAVLAATVAVRIGGNDTPWWLRSAMYAGELAWPALIGLALGWSEHRARRIIAGLTALTSLAAWWWFFGGHWATLLPPAEGQRFFLRLSEIDAGVYVGLVSATAIVALLVNRSLLGDYDFDAVAQSDFGNVRWMSMAAVEQLFPSQGEIVVGELYRPDLDKTNGGGAFDPRNKATWGNGGKAKIAAFNLNFDSSHMLYFAGSGGFKTTSTVVPTALRYSGSMVVLDPSCEVAPLVVAERQRMNQNRKVCVLDPKRKHASEVEGFNVLGPLINSMHQEADAVAFARLLSAESPGKEQGTSAYFQAMAHNLMTGLLLYVLTDDDHERSRNLRALRALTSLSEKELKERLKEIVGLTDNQFVKETLSPFLGMADQTFTGVASTVAKDTQWLSLDHYAALVCGASFSTDELAGGDLDVFVQVPGDILKSYSGVGRVIIGSLMRAMVQADGAHKRRVLFCLDEVDLLGYMNVLEEARDRGRKYGITLMLMYQSVGQLEHHFGKEGATSWFEGVSFVSYAAIKSMDTAKQLSERCGEITIKVENQTQGTSIMFGPMSPTAAGKQSQSFSLQKRALVLPHEIVQEMRADEQIIAVRGQPPIRLGRAVFFRRPEMLAVIGKPKFK